MDFFQTFSWRDVDLGKVLLGSTIAVFVLLMLFNMRNGKGRAKQGRPLPGPRPWPIIGNLGLLSPLAHQDFANLSNKYGPIFHLYLGSVDCVVVSSPGAAKEILKTQDNNFASRPKLTQTKFVTYNGADGFTSPYGPYVRDVKKILTIELMMPKRLQEFQRLRRQEIMSMLRSLLNDGKMGNLVRMRTALSNLTKNNITQMAFSKKYFGPQSSGTNILKESTYFIQILKELLRLYAVIFVGDYIPLLKYIDVQGLKKQMRAAVSKNDFFFDKIIEEHRDGLRQKTAEQHCQEDNMDLVDALLTRPSEGNDGKPFTNTQIKAILVSVIAAGTDTSSAAVEWAMTELLKLPAALRRAQDELDVVVGKNRLVEEDDIPNLPYIRAIVMETLRLHPIVPTMIPHHSKESSEVAGYHIPANSTVFVNVWAMGRDPAVWERPLEFEPERFLHSQKDINGQHFDFLPFGSGRRICPGRALGFLIVQYALAVLLHAFDWALPPGVEPKDVDRKEEPGITICKLHPLDALASPRLPLSIIDKADSTK